MILHFIFMSALSFCGAGSESLIKPFYPEVKLDQTVLFEPVAGHQFNLKSPNQCGQGRLVQINEQKAECEMSVSGQQKIELFVCDEQKSFCKREEHTIFVSGPSGLKNQLNGLFFRFQNLFGNGSKEK